MGDEPVVVDRRDLTAAEIVVHGMQNPEGHPGLDRQLYLVLAKISAPTSKWQFIRIWWTHMPTIIHGIIFPKSDNHELNVRRVCRDIRATVNHKVPIFGYVMAARFDGDKIVTDRYPMMFTIPTE